MSSRVVHLEPPVQPKSDERLEYGDLLLHYLQKEGVTHVFGIPGGALEPWMLTMQHEGPHDCCIVSIHG